MCGSAHRVCDSLAVHTLLCGSTHRQCESLNHIAVWQDTFGNVRLSALFDAHITLPVRLSALFDAVSVAAHTQAVCDSVAAHTV